MVTRRALRWAAILVAVGATNGGATADQFFTPGRLSTAHLTISSDDFERMPPPAPGGPYGEVPATLEFDGRTWDAISVRYKGNSSYRYAPSELKRSFRLRLPTGELNLNNNAFDPSQMRETLAYDVFRRAGVTVPRTGYARVLLTVPGRHDRRYLGLYTLVEPVDEAFLEDRWGAEIGLLLEPQRLEGFPFFGDDWDRYEDAYGARVAKSAERRRFVEFVKLINRSSDAEFADRIGDYLDIDAFLRFLAGQAVLVNTDSPLATGRNYLIAMHPMTRRLVWLPWDLNMAFAGFQPSDASLDVHTPAATGTFPLADRVLAHPQLRAKYDGIVREMMTTNFTRARLDRRIASLERLIGAAAAAEQPPIRSKAPPLRTFIADRVRAVERQLRATTQPS